MNSQCRYYEAFERDIYENLRFLEVFCALIASYATCTRRTMLPSMPASCSKLPICHRSSIPHFWKTVALENRPKATTTARFKDSSAAYFSTLRHASLQDGIVSRLPMLSHPCREGCIVPQGGLVDWRETARLLRMQYDRLAKGRSFIIKLSLGNVRGTNKTSCTRQDTIKRLQHSSSLRLILRSPAIEDSLPIPPFTVFLV